MSELIPFLPEYKEIRVVSALSEVMDWSQKSTRIHLYRKNTKTTGQGIKVVILDTGGSNHIDLCDNVVGMEDFTGECDPLDRKGHGTFVQGIVGALENNIGVIGVAPKCSLYSGKVLNNQGLCPPDYSWIIKGLEWAIDINADIVNMSLGSPVSPPDKMQKIVRVAASKGMILTAASGNARLRLVDFPSRYEGVISVAATDKHGNLAHYSNIGKDLDFIAPGSDVYSTYLDNGYILMSGTSFASPFIAGVCALLLEYYRNGDYHEFPIYSYIDMVEHLKTFQRGRIIDINGDRGIGLLDFGEEYKAVGMFIHQEEECLSWWQKLKRLIRRR